MKNLDKATKEIDDLTKQLRGAREQLEMHAENLFAACRVYLFWKNEADTIAETLQLKFLSKAKNKKNQRSHKKSRKSI